MDFLYFEIIFLLTTNLIISLPSFVIMVLISFVTMVLISFVTMVTSSFNYLFTIFTINFSFVYFKQASCFQALVIAFFIAFNYFKSLEASFIFAIIIILRSFITIVINKVISNRINSFLKDLDSTLNILYNLI